MWSSDALIPVSDGVRNNLRGAVSNLSLYLRTRLDDMGLRPEFNTWAVAQTWSALYGLDPSLPPIAAKLRTFMTERRDPECYCWRETDDKLPHTVATAWVLYALALYHQPAEPQEIAALLDRQAYGGLVVDVSGNAGPGQRLDRSHGMGEFSPPCAAFPEPHRIGATRAHQNGNSKGGRVGCDPGLSPAGPFGPNTLPTTPPSTGITSPCQGSSCIHCERSRAIPSSMVVGLQNCRNRFRDLTKTKLPRVRCSGRKTSSLSTMYDTIGSRGC